MDLTGGDERFGRGSKRRREAARDGHGLGRGTRHKANHVNVAYAPDAATADAALVAKAAMFKAMGYDVHLAGKVLTNLA